MSAQDIRWQDVSAGYGPTTVLENISLTLKKGARIGVIGRNGAGKTTLLSAMSGAAQIQSGAVYAGEQRLNSWPAYRRARAGIGIVPQSRDVFRSLTVRDNLLSGLQGQGEERLEQAYALFPRLKEREANLGANLSGGEQQMLSIARCLMGNPDFLLLDEPLEGLSPLVAQEVMAAIKRLVSERNLACVLVEQHVKTVLDFSEHVVVLMRGQAIFNGPKDELLQRRDILERAIGLQGAR